jgi:hypothetical protein
MSVQGIKTESEANLKADFSLGDFRFHFGGVPMAGGALTCSGTVEDSQLHITVDSAGTSSTRTFDLTQPCYLSGASHLLLLNKGFEEETEHQCLIFDPMSQAMDTLTMKIVGRETVESASPAQEAWRVKMVFQGIEQESWITSQGLRLKDQALDGMMVSRAIPEEEAMAAAAMFQLGGDLAGFLQQVTESFKVQIEGRIENPRQSTRLVLDILGIQPEDLTLDGYWQRMLDDKSEDAFRVEIAHQDNQVSSQDSRENLQSGLLVQSDAPAIREKALEITSGAESNREKAERILKWVYDNMDRSALRMTIPSAVEVLESRKGDCNEHATLFAALARAAGVPTKICSGAMYMGTGFAYHAWNEVAVEDQGWLPVDSAWNQFPADATHLKLVEGELDRQVGVLRAVGKLKLKIVESE